MKNMQQLGCHKSSSCGNKQLKHYAVLYMCMRVVLSVTDDTDRSFNNKNTKKPYEKKEPP